jgi:signal transduction histidine kinase
MLHEFLSSNRADLIDRCRSKVALRLAPRPTPREMEHGIPFFLEQLIETLKAEQRSMALPALGTPGFPLTLVPPEIAATATKHGHELLRHGFSVDQVVHDYGDLCQAVTELAVEKGATVEPDEFHTLNRCLDNAIADAVTAFEDQRDQLISETGNRAMGERLGFLAHELRNFLNTAMMSFAALKRGNVGVDGATSAVLDRSLLGLRDLIDRALADVRLNVNVPSQLQWIYMDRFIAEVQVAAALEATARGCEFTVFPVEPGLAVDADRQLIYSAVSNLLQNAFKFTRPHSHVTLKAYGEGGRVLIEIQDQCGGLPAGKAEAMFMPFEQYAQDRSGLGLGLSISRRAVEASGGKLSVRDMPGVGCVFTIDLPRRVVAASQSDRKLACVSSPQDARPTFGALARAAWNKTDHAASLPAVDP